MMRTLLAALLFFALCPLAARAQDTAVQRISGARIEAVAAREIAALPHAADQAFVAVSRIADQLVSGNHVELRAQAPIGTTTFVNVPVVIDVAGRANRTVYVGYRMQQYVQTAVAAADLVVGTVLTPGDLTMARVPFDGRPPNGIDALVGRKISQTVLKGQPVPIEATSVNQIVTAGSTVIMIVKDDGVVVTADAMARTSGGLGDQVSVYNRSTNKVLSGTVTGPQTVELDISGGDGQ